MKQFLSLLKHFTAAALLLASAPAFADDNHTQLIEIVPAKAEAGAQMGWGECPCFRWSVKVQAASGGVVIKDFLISSDALFKMRSEMELDGSSAKLKLYRVGAVEALWRGGHVGMGFNGLTWGNDPDHGYYDVVRTGLYGLINMILTDSARFDIRSSYDFESMRVDYGSTRVTRADFDQGAVLHWKSGRWSGDVSAHIGLDQAHPFDSHYMRLGAEASLRAKLLSIGQLEMGLDFSGSFDHDPFREMLGLTSDTGVFSIAMDLSYVAAPAHE